MPMNRRYTFFALIVVSLTIALAACSAVAPLGAPIAAAPAPAGKMGDYVRGFLQRRHIPSAAVAVVRDGRIIHAAGYGLANLELDVPATERTRYEIGSISKQFTAEAIMMLVEEGKLGLDDPIGQYLKDIPSAWSGIAVRHLLTHTSGLHDWERESDFSYRREYTPAEFIRLIGGYPLDFPPGDRFSYTNSAFPLLGLIVEAVTATRYERFVAERIFGPAGMTDTLFKHPEDIVKNRSGGYVDRDGVLRNGEPLRPGIIAPNGGIMSTAVDLAKWDIALSKGVLVKPETLDRMTAPIRLNDGKPYNAGIAWFIDTYRGHRLLLHNGSTVAGYSSVVYRYPGEKLGVAVLLNVDRWNAVNILATRVAAFFVPGLSNAELPERKDPAPEGGKKFLALLGDIAEGRGSDMLGQNLKTSSGAPGLPRDWGFKGQPDRFAFLEKEDLGEEGAERYGRIVRWIYRYRLTAGARVIDYTFEMSADGKVVRFFPEEE